MSVLYVIDQGASLHKKGNRLVIEKQGREIQSVHAFKVDQVVLMGTIFITPPTIAYLLAEGIDTVFLSVHGKYRGRLVARMGKNVLLRQEQFRVLCDPEVAWKLAAKYISGKLLNCRVVLRKQNSQLNDQEITQAIHMLRVLIKRLERATDMDEIRGIEGKGTAVYFQGLRKAIRAADMPFNARTRRPPRDPVNILLSLGYTLLANTVETSVNLVGFDPYLGCLHGVEYGRPSLVLDLMEEFRPVMVDSLVLRLINRRVITSRHFYRNEESEPLPDGMELEHPTPADYPILLSHEGMKRFIVNYEARLNEKIFYLPEQRRLTFRDVCTAQARLLARHVRGEAVYEPFVIR